MWLFLRSLFISVLFLGMSFFSFVSLCLSSGVLLFAPQFSRSLSFAFFVVWHFSFVRLVASQSVCKAIPKCNRSLYIVFTIQQRSIARNKTCQSTPRVGNDLANKPVKIEAHLSIKWKLVLNLHNYDIISFYYMMLCSLVFLFCAELLFVCLLFLVVSFFLFILSDSLQPSCCLLFSFPSSLFCHSVGILLSVVYPWFWGNRSKKRFRNATDRYVIGVTMQQNNFHFLKRFPLSFHRIVCWFNVSWVQVMLF